MSSSKQVVSNESNMAEAYKWESVCLSKKSIPMGALGVGKDTDGHEIYAARARHAGNLIPGKFVQAKNVCNVGYAGRELSKDEFELLVPAQFIWQFARDGQVPPGAIEAGETDKGEKLYFGRVTRDGHTSLGKIHPSHGLCFYPYRGEERNSPKYECLVLL